MRRGELGDHRCCNGIIRSYKYADEETCNYQAQRISSKNREDGERRNCYQVDDEHNATPNKVGKITTNNGADQNAQKYRSTDQCAPCLGKIKQRSNLRQRNANQRKHITVQKRSAARKENDLTKERRH